jgi:glycosyltransferase involved in cell wall biosynthesis
MSSRLPFISVIIPTYNEEKYIEHTLKAIKSQDYSGKYEIVVSDGTSKDGTVKIARKYADEVVEVKKRGISVGRNAGAKVASGDILLFVDADTVLLFNCLTEFAKTFKVKSVVGATCPIAPTSSRAVDFMLYWMANQFVKSSIKTGVPQLFGICCAYRQSAFESVGGFDEKLHTHEDIDLSQRMAKLGKIVFVESTLALTSPRRFEAWGRTKGAGKYVAYYLNYLLTGKGVGRNRYRAIR